MAVIEKQSPLAQRFMLLSISAGLLLFGVGMITHWQKVLTQSQQAQSRPSPAPIIDSPRAKDTLLVVDLSDRRVMIYRNEREIARYPLAVGQAGWETPIGRFKIHQLRQNPDWQHPITKKVIPAGPSNPLGTRWIGFYQGEYMALGFHGTPNESLIGRAVSHGCLRMRNRDIEAMYKHVGAGVVVKVQR